MRRMPSGCVKGEKCSHHAGGTGEELKLKEALLERLRSQRLYDLGLQLGRAAEGSGQPGDSSVSMSLHEVLEARRLFSGSGLEAKAAFAAEDLYVRARVEPVQALLTEWMAGARAQVDGEDIPFTQIITWCQECDSWIKRRILEREARSLCRFLAPFSHATWKAFEAAATEDLGYSSYLDYCQARREADFGDEAAGCRALLEHLRPSYRAELQRWFAHVFPGKNMAEANRFDAIYLLGMRYMDSAAHETICLDKALGFFAGLGVDEDSGLRLHIEGRPGRQSYCVPIEIPGRVHLIIGPVSGWVDWEALFHEMGHAFSFIHTDPALPLEAREFFLSGAVSEAFAFLFQRLSMTEPFLTWMAGRWDGKFSMLEALHGFKFQLLERRYGAKFLIEYENFKSGKISRGQDLYAEIMARETGFSYDPETYLFDLMPDFYSLDYYLAFRASAVMARRLEEEFGRQWFKEADAASMLKEWAAAGNLYEIRRFMSEVVGSRLDAHAEDRN